MTMDAQELIRQIGRGNLMAISGLRWSTSGKGGTVHAVHLPVGHGYRVDIMLQDDLYTVRRVFSRKPKGDPFAEPVDYAKGERTHVYAEDIGKVARYAASYESYDENEWVHKA